MTVNKDKWFIISDKDTYLPYISIPLTEAEAREVWVEWRKGDEAYLCKVVEATDS